MLLLLAPVSNFCSGPASLIIIPYNEAETKNVLLLILCYGGKEVYGSYGCN